jgi:hypothetical protein
MTDLEKVRKLLLTFFGDDDKVDTWLNSSNANFGGCTPMKLFQADRGHKVLAFVENALEENER